MAQCRSVVLVFLYHAHPDRHGTVIAGPIPHKFPFELLHLIFEFTIPPRLFLDPSFSFGPHSAWSHATRQLKAHVLVCKMWWDVGIDLLYQDISIRHVDQTPALLRTLKLNTRLGPLVRTFQVHCHMPPSFMRMLRHGLSEIPDFCPNIVRLVINHETESPHFHDFEWFARLCYKPIVDLELTLDRTLIAHLALYSDLRSLTIHIKDREIRILAPLVLNRLEEFNCVWQSHMEGDSLITELIHEAWAMPNLKQLSVYSDVFGFLRENPRCLPFIRKHGKNLICLGLRGLHTTESLQDALSLCPSLRRLVVDMSRGFTFPLSFGIFHPTLEYIDLWADPHHLDLQSWTASTIASHKPFFPALRNVRIIDEALFSVGGLRLPIAISPDESEGRWVYPGISIFHSSFCLVRDDMDHVESYYETIKADYEDKPHAIIGSGDGNDEDAAVDSDDADDYEWLPGSHTLSDVSEGYCSRSDFEDDDLMSLESALELFTCRQATVYASSAENESND